MMVYSNKVEVVEEYEEVIYRNEDRIIRMPSVVKLCRPISNMKRAVKFSRINVLTRDGFRCQYCGSQKKAKELNYDHVVPRHKGGKTNWLNIVSSCYRCNSKKANRTPEEAGMKLLKKPVHPGHLPFMGPRFNPKEIPEAWVDFVKEFFDESAVA